MHDKTGMDSRSPLILQRTTKEDVEKGVTVITRGEGVFVYDQEGKRYLDLVAGVTRPVHAGYGRKEIAQAVYDQICRLPYFTPMQFTNEPALQLARVLSEIAPGKISKFSFFCDGSESVEAASKLARHYHYFQGEKSRFKIISRRGAYHGVTAGALRALGTVLAMRQIMEPLMPGTVFVDSPYCYRCPLHLTYPGCDLACAKDIARAIEFENPEQVSAFIGEPIQQGFGAYAPPAEYWKIVREICDKYGIVLIIDEVICGSGELENGLASNILTSSRISSPWPRESRLATYPWGPWDAQASYGKVSRSSSICILTGIIPLPAPRP